MRLSIPDFCDNVGVKKVSLNIKDVTGTWAHLLKTIHFYIEKANLKDKVIVNDRVLKECVVDFYVDISRIRLYHPIDEPSIEKDDAYKAYWLLRRKAIQATKQFDNCEFINELFVSTFLLGIITRQKNIDDTKKKKNPTWGNFRKLLYRTLVFRTVTAQSLELMIEAFFCGCDFSAGTTTAETTSP
jgi:hypothetical protein